MAKGYPPSRRGSSLGSMDRLSSLASSSSLSSRCSRTASSFCSMLFRSISTSIIRKASDRVRSSSWLLIFTALNAFRLSPPS